MEGLHRLTVPMYIQQHAIAYFEEVAVFLELRLYPNSIIKPYFRATLLILALKN